MSAKYAVDVKNITFFKLFVFGCLLFLYVFIRYNSSKPVTALSMINIAAKTS